MSPPDRERWDGPVADEPVSYPVVGRRTQFAGRVWDVCSDDVEFPSGRATRDFVAHTGAVAVVALNDANELFLIRQYRHPVATALFELPAGLLDVPGEDPLVTAQRELAEEAGLTADIWHVLADFFTSPGGSSEAIRLYLARSVAELPDGRVETGEAEEVELPGVWVPLDEATDLVRSGAIENAIAVIGILATAAAADQGFDKLRAGDSAWQARENLINEGRVRLRGRQE